jgi:hemerythrin superfamily protein
MNALELLRKEHSFVRNLFDQFERTSKTPSEKRMEVFATIRRELQLHCRAEEEIFYPALKAMEGEGRRLVVVAIKEHHDIDALLTRISRRKLNDKEFDSGFEALVESVNDHLDYEEGEIFRFAEENCSPQQLEEIGSQIEDRRRILDQEMAA